MQPDQARFLLNSVLLPGLDNEHRTSVRVIEAIPPDKSGYKPDGISMSSLELASHFVSAEISFMSAVCAGSFGGSPKVPETVKTSKELSAWYGEQFSVVREKLPKLPDEALTKALTFGPFQLPAVSFLNFAIMHSVHHRGQLSMYLRPMGAKVPAIYGESFDSKEAKKSS